MNIAIIGSRSFTDYEKLKCFIKEKISLENVDFVVSGGAKGADKLGELFADEHGIDKKIFLPDWNKFGKQAGFIRNKDIIENSDVVFAFWNGFSKGTKNSLKLAEKLNKKIYLYEYIEAMEF